MERIRALTGTLVATLLYFTSFGVEAKVLSCEATKGNGRGWIPREFQIDLSSDRATARVISPVTEVFGAKPFEKSFLGSSLWSRGKGRSTKGDYYNYQLRLDLDSNDTEAKVVMTMQGYRDTELRFSCVAGGSNQLVADSSSTQPTQVSKLASYDWAEVESDLDQQPKDQQIQVYSSIREFRKNIPGWVRNPPISQDQIFSVGLALPDFLTRETADMNATQYAKDELALNLRSYITGELRRRGFKAGPVEKVLSVIHSKELRPLRKVVVQVNGKYGQYVLYGFSIQAISEILTEQQLVNTLSGEQIRQQASTSNDPIIQLIAGADYEYGRGVSVDVVRARTLYEKAALAGNPLAMTLLGLIYEQGKGIPVDYLKAKYWYEKGAKTNYAMAMHNLAHLTIEDRIPGSTDDLSDSKKLLLRASRQGYKASRQSLNDFDYKLPYLTEKDWREIDGNQWIELTEGNQQKDLNNLAEEKLASIDKTGPDIIISESFSDRARGTISGIATDNSGIAEILVDGEQVPFDSSGRFTASTYVPEEGLDVTVEVIDLKGLSTTQTVRLERTKRTQTVSRLAAVNPLVGPKQKPSRDRAALIIGLEKYAEAPPADYASRDAQMFADYAREKLGIAPGNIKVLTDTEATRSGLLRALKVWLPQAVQPDKTDLYVFYAGHGMASDDGESAYIVPYGADTFLLEDTAISRERFYEEIGAAKPRTATFFFDNCYAGTTRSEERLLAQRPLSIKVQESPVPENYLVFTAGESNQTAGVLDEVKHGRFSYFVFKGLEGEADANRDGKISAGELHQYVRESVGRFSAGAQTPTMLGDGSRWVLR